MTTALMRVVDPGHSKMRGYEDWEGGLERMSPAELERFLIQSDRNPEFSGFFKKLSRKVFRPVGRVLKKVAPIALTMGIGGGAAGALGLKSHTIAGKLISKGIIGNIGGGRKNAPQTSGATEASVQGQALDNAGIAAGKAIAANSVPTAQMRWLRAINSGGMLGIAGSGPSSFSLPDGTTFASAQGSVEKKDGSVTRSDPRKRGYKAAGKIIEMTDAQAIAAGFDPRSAVRNPLAFGAPTAADFAKARNLGDLLLLKGKSELAKGASAGISGILGGIFGNPNNVKSDAKVSANVRVTNKNVNPTGYAGQNYASAGKKGSTSLPSRKSVDRTGGGVRKKDVTIGTGSTIAIILLLVVLAFGGGALVSRTVG